MKKRLLIAVLAVATLLSALASSSSNPSAAMAKTSRGGQTSCPAGTSGTQPYCVYGQCPAGTPQGSYCEIVCPDGAKNGNYCTLIICPEGTKPGPYCTYQQVPAGDVAGFVCGGKHKFKVHLTLPAGFGLRRARLRIGHKRIAAKRIHYAKLHSRHPVLTVTLGTRTKGFKLYMKLIGKHKSYTVRERSFGPCGSKASHKKHKHGHKGIKGIHKKK